MERLSLRTEGQGWKQVKADTKTFLKQGFAVYAVMPCFFEPPNTGKGNLRRVNGQLAVNQIKIKCHIYSRLQLKNLGQLKIYNLTLF